MSKGKKGNKLGIFIALSLILFVIAIIMFFVSTTSGSAEVKDFFKYNVASTIEYSIYPDKGDNKEYNSDKVKQVNTTINYSFFTDNKIDIEYLSDIEATLLAKEQDGKVILKKSYLLKEEVKEKIANTNNLNINEDLEIDYEKYNNLAKEELKNHDLKDLDVYLEVALNVKTESNVSKNKFENTSKTILNIPLLKESFEITPKPVREENTFNGKVSTLIKNKQIFIYSILTACVAGVILIITFICFLVNPSNDLSYHSEYRKVRKMVREYDELIKRTYKMPSIKDKSVKELDSIDEFMSIQDKYDLPMTMVEKERDVIFVMVDNKKAWTYSIAKLQKKSKTDKNM